MGHAEQDLPRDPGNGGERGRRWHAAGKPDPNGNRAARRAYRRSQPKTLQRSAYVVESRSHMWHDETGICVLHGKRCPRPN